MEAMLLSREEEIELFNERAAIREYLGGYSREEAEKLAYEDVKQIQQEKKNDNQNG